MADIPTVTLQILGPNEGAADGTVQSLWFKVQSTPPPPEDLVVGLKVCASNGKVQQSGVIMILKHESHSADQLDITLEIEPFASLSNLEFPIFTNEGYVIEAGHEFLEYNVGSLSKIVPYQWNGPDRGVWTDEKR